MWSADRELALQVSLARRQKNLPTAWAVGRLRVNDDLKGRLRDAALPPDG